MIDSLIRKPGAFINYKYLNHMYPTTRFRMAYHQLLQHTTEAAAVKQYLKLLYAAKHEGLDLVDDALRWFLTEGRAITADDVLHVVASTSFPLRPTCRSKLPISLRSILFYNTRRCTMSPKTTTTKNRRTTTTTTKTKKADWPPTIDTSKLPEQLKELRLPTFRETHSSTAEQAAREHWTHTQFLAELVDKECQTRTHSRIVRLLRDANLLAGKTWDAFNWSRLPPHVTQQFETLRQGDFLNRQDDLLLFGKPGSGKTMLLSALGDQLVKRGRSVLFATCQMLVQELLRAKRDLRLERLIKKLQKFEALIIDDLGYVQQSREEMEVLFTLLSERYERGSVLLSSNLPFSKWEQIFKDPMTTAAAIDRLIHHSVIIELNIPSYRLDEAKRKQPKSARSDDGSTA